MRTFFSKYTIGRTSFFFFVFFILTRNSAVTPYVSVVSILLIRTTATSERKKPTALMILIVFEQINALGQLKTLVILHTWPRPCTSHTFCRCKAVNWDFVRRFAWSAVCVCVASSLYHFPSTAAWPTVVEYLRFFFILFIRTLDTDVSGIDYKFEIHISTRLHVQRHKIHMLQPSLAPNSGTFDQ